MATAEDDEIILQEVIVEQNNISPPRVARSDSLQIPGATASASSEKKISGFSRLRNLSPKIAPKFPREKLKSMFRKRKLSSALLFHKLKGVRFSRDTKHEDESESESLLNVEHEPLEVSITLSSPELTEIEKETGVHPYYFTQQAIISGKQLVMNRAFTVRQASLTRSESEEDNLTGRLKVDKCMPRSSSLPNIQQSDSTDVCINDPIITTALKKISKAKKPKGETHKLKKKKKSPPPESRRTSDDTQLHTDPQGLEGASDNDLSTRRNTLPQIMLTRCDRKIPEHLDLAVSPTHSSQSSSQSSDSGAQGSATSVTPKSVTKKDSSPLTQKSGKTHIDKSSSGKSVELNSKQEKDSSVPSKLKTTSSKDQKKIAQKSQEQPPKLPPRMPISGIKVTSDKNVALAETPLPKKETSLQTKFEATTVSKDTTKPSQTMTLKKGSSQTIGPTSVSEAVDEKVASGKVQDLHSKSTTASPKPVAFETTTWKAEAAKKSQLRRKSPPPPKRTSPPPPKRASPSPPKRPETLLLAAKAPDLLRKRGSISAKKIAGIQLATTPQSPPQSPSIDIPSPSFKGQILTFPKPTLKLSEPHSSTSSHTSIIPSPSKEVKSISFPRSAIKMSPKRSPTKESSTSFAEMAKADTVVTIYDSQEDLQRVHVEKGQDSARPPDAPKRHLPRQISRVKK